MTWPSLITSDNSHDQICPTYFTSFPLNSVQRNFVYIFQSKYVGRAINEWNSGLLAHNQGLGITVFKSRQRKHISLFPERLRPALVSTEPPIEFVTMIFLNQKAAGAWRWPLTFITFYLHLAPWLQMIIKYKQNVVKHTQLMILLRFISYIVPFNDMFRLQVWAIFRLTTFS